MLQVDSKFFQGTSQVFSPGHVDAIHARIFRSIYIRLPVVYEHRVFSGYSQVVCNCAVHFGIRLPLSLHCAPQRSQ